jgi:4-amino-4-deoxychorismate lyase
MMLAAWIDGIRGESVALGDRALHYGDGAFTTIRVHAQQACWIAEHLQRLHQSCAGLRLPDLDFAQLRAETEDAARVEHAGIVKVLLSRGDGARGYAPQGATGRRIVFAYALPAADVSVYAEGVKLRHADLVLSQQPALAGYKHANRLEQIMARAEWDDPAIADALLCDAEGRVVSATSANIFARFGTELRTPSLVRAGVAGICRQHVLQSPPPGFSVTVTDMHRDALGTADELFLSNCLRGIVPVRALGDHVYASMSAARSLMRALHPALGLPVY